MLCLHKYCCFDPLFSFGAAIGIYILQLYCSSLLKNIMLCHCCHNFVLQVMIFFWCQFATVSIRRLLYIQNPADRKTWLPEGMKPWISKAPSTTSKGRLSLKPSHFLWIMPAWLLASHGNTDHANIHVCARPVLWKYSKFLRLLNLRWAHPKTTPSASCLGRNEPEHWLICSLVKIVLKRWL